MTQGRFNKIMSDIANAIVERITFHGWGRLFIAAGGKEVLKKLTERESSILSMRFGLEDGITHTLEEVGKLFGVTRDRIRQIEGKALAKIEYYNNK